MMSDWASVTYEGFTPDGMKVNESEVGRRFNFRVGHYEVSKCWDIAIQQMRPGETSTISCPGILDQGGNINQFIGESSAWLPTYQDMQYKIRVIGCDPKITIPKSPRVG